MIRSFRDRAAESLWMGAFVKRFSGIENLQAMYDLTKARIHSGAAVERDVRPRAA